MRRDPGPPRPTAASPIPPPPPPPHPASRPYPRREEEVQVLMQQGLVARVPRAELLQELVGVAQNLHHLGITLGIRMGGGR